MAEKLVSILCWTAIKTKVWGPTFLYVRPKKKTNVLQSSRNQRPKTALAFSNMLCDIKPRYSAAAAAIIRQ